MRLQVLRDSFQCGASLSQRRLEQCVDADREIEFVEFGMIGRKIESPKGHVSERGTFTLGHFQTLLGDVDSAHGLELPRQQRQVPSNTTAEVACGRIRGAKSIYMTANDVVTITGQSVKNFVIETGCDGVPRLCAHIDSPAAEQGTRSRGVSDS